MSEGNDKVAWHGELMLAEAKWSDKDGHMVKFKLADSDPDHANPFKKWTKRRKGRAGTRFSAVLVEVKRPDRKSYVGELMLAGWGDTSTQGHTVTFWVEPPVGARMHPFEGYDRDRDSFMAALVELQDDEEPVEQAVREKVEATPPPKKPKRQALSQAAALLCTNPIFWQWAEAQGEWQVNSEQEAAEWLRDQLGIDSRRMLDMYDHVAQQFHEQIRKPFVEWCNAREGVPF